MANEVLWQTKLIKMIRNSGGYARKWATQYAVGVPDLVVSLRGLGLVTVEVKLLKKWEKNTERTLKLTPKQVHELNAINEGGGRAFVLVILEIDKGHGVARVYYPPKRQEKMTIRRQEFMHTAFDLKNTVGFTAWLRAQISHMESINA